MAFNIMLDRLPEDFKGYLIRTDFRIYIQITQCLCDDSLEDDEKISTALWLLYGMSQPPLEIAYEGLMWYLNFTNEPFENEPCENSKRRETTQDTEPCMSFDIDSSRIYTAFKRYYNIDLKSAYVHWAEFLYMLKDLGECAYTSVVDIRSKKLKGMSDGEKRTYRKLKEKYRLKPKLSDKQTEQIQKILSYKKST